MTTYHQLYGLRHGRALFVDPHWSPEQTIALIEVLDDLRDLIWTHYQTVLLNQYQKERTSYSNSPLSDPPF